MYKRQHYILLLFSFILFSCEPDPEKEIEDLLDSVETITLNHIIRVIDFPNAYGWIHNRNIHNSNVKIMYEDLILDEINTDEDGLFKFDEQEVPVEGAFLLIETPGYCTTVLKIDSTINETYTIFLMDEEFPDITGSAYDGDETYINITGGNFDISHAQSVNFMYITNTSGIFMSADRELNNRFAFAVLPNEELLLHYTNNCGEYATRELGSFTEDTDIGELLDEELNQEIYYFDGYIFEGSICPDLPQPQPGNIKYKIFYKQGGETNLSMDEEYFFEFKCKLGNSTPVAILINEPLSLIHI